MPSLKASRKGATIVATGGTGPRGVRIALIFPDAGLARVVRDLPGPGPATIAGVRVPGRVRVDRAVAGIETGTGNEKRALLRRNRCRRFKWL